MPKRPLNFPNKILCRSSFTFYIKQVLSTKQLIASPVSIGRHFVPEADDDGTLSSRSKSSIFSVTPTCLHTTDHLLMPLLPLALLSRECHGSRSRFWKSTVQGFLPPCRACPCLLAIWRERRLVRLLYVTGWTLQWIGLIIHVCSPEVFLLFQNRRMATRHNQSFFGPLVLNRKI